MSRPVGTTACDRSGCTRAPWDTAVRSTWRWRSRCGTPWGRCPLLRQHTVTRQHLLIFQIELALSHSVCHMMFLHLGGFSCWYLYLYNVSCPILFSLSGWDLLDYLQWTSPPSPHARDVNSVNSRQRFRTLSAKSSRRWQFPPQVAIWLLFNIYKDWDHLGRTSYTVFNDGAQPLYCCTSFFLTFSCCVMSAFRRYIFRYGRIIWLML